MSAQNVPHPSCLMWLVHNNLLEQQSNVLPIPSLSEINKILVISNTLSITYTELLYLQSSWVHMNSDVICLYMSKVPCSPNFL